MAKKRKKRKITKAWSWRRLEDYDPGLQMAVKAAGGITRLAEKLGIAPQAIAQWGPIPYARILEVERVTKVSRRKLRPDLFLR